MDFCEWDCLYLLLNICQFCLYFPGMSLMLGASPTEGFRGSQKFELLPDSLPTQTLFCSAISEG